MISSPQTSNLKRHGACSEKAELADSKRVILGMISTKKRGSHFDNLGFNDGLCLVNMWLLYGSSMVHLWLMEYSWNIHGGLMMVNDG